MSRLRKLYKKLDQEVRFILRTVLQPTIITTNGFQIHIANDSISPMIKSYIYHETYEAHEKDIISKTLDKDDIILELGGGIGFIGLFCSKIISSEQIHIFEANPSLIEIIQNNFSLNHRETNIHNVIISDHDGEIDFYVRDNFWASSIVQPKTNDYKIVKVKTKSLKAVLDDVKPTYLICDIEGGEYDLLLNQDLGSIRKICLEVHPWSVGERETSEMISYLLKQDFHIQYHLSKGNVLFFQKDSQI